MLKKGEILHEVLLSSLKDILLTRLIKIDFKLTPHGHIITLQCHIFQAVQNHKTRILRLRGLFGTNNQELFLWLINRLSITTPFSM